MRRLFIVLLSLTIYEFGAHCLQAQDGSEAAASEDVPSRLSTLNDDAAWTRMPRVEEEPTDRRLPVWARVLAGPLPRTAGAMLELDYVYRTSTEIDPRLRAKMRWVAADANRCSYGQAYAEADLLRAGGTQEDLGQLKAGAEPATPGEADALTFARKLTLSAATITDEEVARLVAVFGEPQVVAMVLQTAYANFQDRLLLTFGVEVEEGGPLPPLAVRFVRPAATESIAVDRPLLDSEKVLPAPRIDLGTDWTSVRFEQLLNGMDQQRERPGRVSVPKWQDFYPRLPVGMYPADRPTRVKWTLVVLGHQPDLGSAWLEGMRTFGREANQDRVFEETLFWVITRTIDCFY